MARRLLSSGSIFEEQVGYSRAVVDREWVFVSGTTGFDYTTMTISEDPESQCRQCPANIDQALREADANASHIVRVNYYLVKAEDFEPCWPALREYFHEIQC